MADDWLKQVAPTGGQVADLYGFLGLTPEEKDKLADRIAKKRRFWRAHESSPNKAGREKAEQVLENLKAVAGSLLDDKPYRGVVHGTTAEHLPGPVETRQTRGGRKEATNWYRLVDELCTDRQFKEAWEMATRAEDKEGVLLRGWVAYNWEESGSGGWMPYAKTALKDLLVNPKLGWNQWAEITLGLQYALKDYEGCRTWAQKIRDAGHKLPDVGRVREILSMEGSQATLSGFVEELRTFDETSRGIFVMEEMSGKQKMLPIKTRKDLNEWVDLVHVCQEVSSGMPDLEQFMVPYRFWAEKAKARLFTGDPVKRSLVGSATAGSGAAVYTMLKSKPAWQILCGKWEEGSVEAGYQDELLRRDEVRKAHGWA